MGLQLCGFSVICCSSFHLLNYLSRFHVHNLLSFSGYKFLSRNTRGLRGTRRNIPTSHLHSLIISRQVFSRAQHRRRLQSFHLALIFWQVACHGWLNQSLTYFDACWCCTSQALEKDGDNMSTEIKFQQVSHHCWIKVSFKISRRLVLYIAFWCCCWWGSFY